MRLRIACVAVLTLLAALLASPPVSGQTKQPITITPIVVTSPGWNVCRPTTPHEQTRSRCTACCNEMLTIGTITPGQLPTCLLRCNTLPKL